MYSFIDSYPPQDSPVWEKRDGGGRYILQYGQSHLATSSSSSFSLHASSFFPSISLIFHSAWLVPWQGEIGWDDSQRGGEVMGCIVKTSFPTLPLSSSSSFHLVPLPFLIFCLPLHLFPYSYTVSCLSVLLFLFLHLLHLSFLLALRNEELFTGIGYREERKREWKRRTACTIITCYSVSPQFSLAHSALPFSQIFILQSRKTLEFLKSFLLFVSSPIFISYTQQKTFLIEKTQHWSLGSGLFILLFLSVSFYIMFLSLFFFQIFSSQASFLTLCHHFQYFSISTDMTCDSGYS